jgi:uncharacterized SAM-binding protein YcdF (DUF218 family)
MYLKKFGLLFLPAAFVVSACSYSGRAAKNLLLQAKAGEPFDAVVVPGVPLSDGKWDRIMKGRIYWSRYLLDQGITRNIIFSGSSVYSPYYEAIVMSLYAQAIGVPGGHIYTELKAEHSTENVYYSFRYARQLGFSRIALASDPFQTRTLRSFARRKVNANIVMIPMVTDILKVLEPSMKDPDVNFEPAFNPRFVSIRKRDSFWKRLHGTIWGNMDTRAYH